MSGALNLHLAMLLLIFFCSLQTSLFGSTTTSAPTGLFGTQGTGFGQTQTGTGLFGQTPGFGQTQQQVGIKINNYIKCNNIES